MKTSNRILRVNDEILKVSSQIIREEIKDPRIHLLTSVMKVDTTNDLSYSTIYVSVLGTKEEAKDTIEGLKSSAGYFRNLIAKKLNLRNTPQFKFVLDETMEYAAKIDGLVKQINEQSRKEGVD